VKKLQVNSISSLLQLQQLQALTGNDGSLSTDNTTSSFASLLQGMLQNTQTAASQTNPISSAVNSSVSGLDSLSLDPQKLTQMLQLQSMENMLTNAESADSDSYDNSDGASDDSTSIMPNTTNDMSQMYSYILEALNQNSNQTASTAAAFTDSSGLVSASANTESSTSSQA
jgi:hypothetical protein